MNWRRLTKKAQKTLPPTGTRVLLWQVPRGDDEAYCRTGCVNYEGKLRAHGDGGAYPYFSHYALVERPRKPYKVAV